MNVQNDIKTITNSLVTLAAFGAQKLAKATEGQAIATTFANLKAGFDAIKPGVVITQSQLAVFIFQILSAAANESQSFLVQDLESLARQLYSLFTGGQGVDWETTWQNIQALFTGKLKGLPSAPLTPAQDAQNFEQGIIGVFGFVIGQLPSDTPEEDIQAIIAGVSSGLDALDITVAITVEEATTAVGNIFGAISDITGNTALLVYQQVSEKIFGILAGNQSGFVKFWDSAVAAIELKIAEKKAAKLEAAKK